MLCLFHVFMSNILVNLKTMRVLLLISMVSLHVKFGALVAIHAFDHSDHFLVHQVSNKTKKRCS